LEKPASTETRHLKTAGSETFENGLNIAFKGQVVMFGLRKVEMSAFSETESPLFRTPIHRTNWSAETPAMAKCKVISPV
jgi:hypothetical protein